MDVLDFMCKLHPKHDLHDNYLDSSPTITKLMEQITADQSPVMIQIYTEHLLMCQSGKSGIDATDFHSLIKIVILVRSVCTKIRVDSPKRHMMQMKKLRMIANVGFGLFEVEMCLCNQELSVDSTSDCFKERKFKLSGIVTQYPPFIHIKYCVKIWNILWVTFILFNSISLTAIAHVAVLANLKNHACELFLLISLVLSIVTEKLHRQIQFLWPAPRIKILKMEIPNLWISLFGWASVFWHRFTLIWICLKCIWSSDHF